MNTCSGNHKGIILFPISSSQELSHNSQYDDYSSVNADEEK